MPTNDVADSKDNSEQVRGNDEASNLILSNFVLISYLLQKYPFTCGGAGARLFAAASHYNERLAHSARGIF